MPTTRLLVCLALFGALAGCGTTDTAVTDAGADEGGLRCPECEADEICVFLCDGDGSGGGFVSCEPNPQGCTPGNTACSAECETSLCGGQESQWSCQQGVYCPEIPGAFYCQGS